MPAGDSLPAGVVGVDCGASLTKVVWGGGEDFGRETLASADRSAIVARLIELAPRRVAVTGGGAASLASMMAAAEAIDGTSQPVGEFAAWAAGAAWLARRRDLTLPERYLLVSLGTGTSILEVGSAASGSGDGHRPVVHERVGGSALGGGTIVGLGRLLLDTGSFPEIAELAARGDRRGVDLLVSDVYPGHDGPLAGELNAASFGKLASREPADLASAIMGLVGENVALIAAALARRSEAAVALYAGSPLTGNPALEAVIEAVAEHTGGEALFLEQGAYCGAVGAALAAG